MKVYQYGISAVHNEAEVVEQMWHGHRYKNKLIEIENLLRDQRDESQAPYFVGITERLAEIEVQIEELRGEQRKANSRARTKAGDKKALLDAIKPLKDERKELWAKRKEIVQAVKADESLQAKLGELREASYQAIRDARKETEAYWGTYLICEKAIEQAKKPILPGPDDPPEMRIRKLKALIVGRIKYRRWDGSGSVAVQIQNGLDTSEIFGSNTNVRIDPVDEGAWDPRVPRGERSRLCRTTLSLRIGSEGRDPVWAKFRLHLHRPLPPGRIKWVKIHRIPLANKWRWVCDITVDEVKEHPLPERPACGLDIGWRVRKDGLRIAMVVHENGTIEEFVLPQKIRDRLRKIDDLKSIRDQNFNVAKEKLRESLKAIVDLPDWLKEDVQTLHSWKAKKRLSMLAVKWRDYHFEEGSQALLELEAWRKQDKHLWTWEVNLRDKVYRRRREVYRVWAKGLTERYGRIYLESINLCKFAENKPAEIDDGSDEMARRHRCDGALSVFRTALKDAASARSTDLIKVNPAWTTKTCHSCGFIDRNWDPATDLLHCCSSCGKNWDQDVNAAINILELAASA